MSRPHPVIDEIAARLGLDADSIAERLRFLEFTAQDEQRLRELHDHLERTGAGGFFVDASTGTCRRSIRPAR